MIDDWTTRLSDEHPGPKIIQTVAQAFLAAVETVGLDQGDLTQSLLPLPVLQLN